MTCPDFDLAIFGCDGTLVDTEIPVNQAFITKLHEHAPADYRHFDVDYNLHKCVGATFYGIFDRMAQNVQTIISDTARDIVIKQYQDIYPEYLKKIG